MNPVIYTFRRLRLACFLILLPVLVSANGSVDSVDWVADGQFTQGVEGPVVDRQGNLYAVNFARQGTIGKVGKQGHPEVFVTLPGSSVGNGLRFNARGELLVADYVNHNVLLVNMGSLEVSVFAHNADMNQPNDIAISDTGFIYASDPNWAQESGQLWMIDDQGHSRLIEADMGTTNGVEVAQGDQFLYVNESVQRRIWRYGLGESGVPENKTLFYSFDKHGLDGMRSDNQGNLYVARYGAGEVAVISPEGELIGQYRLKGQYPTNVAFGGCDGKTLFVTMQKRGAIEKLKVDTVGRSFAGAANCDGEQ